MGSGSSSEQKIVNESVNKAITNVVTSKSDSTDTKISNGNVIGNIEFGPRAELNNCTVDLSQKIRSKSTIYKISEFKNLTELRDTIKNALDAKITGENNTEQGAFATALNVNVSKSEMINSVHNLVEKNITETTLSDFNSVAENLNNKGTIMFNGKCNGSTIDMSQEILFEQLVSLLTSDLTQTTSQNEQDTSQSGDSSQRNTVKQQGAIDALAGLMQGPFIIIGLIVIVMAVLAFVFRKSISKIAEKKTGVSFGRKIEKMINSIKKM